MSGQLDSGVIGDRIDVYEDRVSGRLLRPIRTLLETLGSVSMPGARFMYRLASRLASVHPAA